MKKQLALILSILMLLCLLPAITAADGAWSVIGDICGTVWDRDFPMTETEPGVWTSDELELHAGEMLKVRFDGSWEQNYGIAFDWDGSDPVLYESGGRNLVIPADGTYTVTLHLSDPVTITLTKDGETVLPQTEPDPEPFDPFSHTWTVIGSIFDTQWDTDFEMTETEPGVWQAGPWALHASEEFKARADFDWGVWNYGTETGENCVVEADGTYLITLNLNDDPIVVTLELTDQEPVDPVIVQQPDDPGEEYERMPLTEEDFPDANFRAWIEAQDGWTEEEDGVTYLTGWARGSDRIDCSAQGIESLAGIQFFPNLRYLDAGEQWIEDENGEWIYGGANALTSFDASLAPHLVELNLNGSQITELDVSELSDLERLDCAGNGLTSLTLGDLPNLYYLYASDQWVYLGEGQDGYMLWNQLETLDLSGVPSLKYLHVSGNRLTSLDASSLSELEGLWCDGNPITFLTLPDHILYGSLELREIEATEGENGTYTFDLSTILIPELIEKIDTGEWNENKTFDAETGVVTFAYRPEWEQFCFKTVFVHEDDENWTEDLWIYLTFSDGGSVPVSERVALNEDNFPDASFRAWLEAQDGWTEEEDGVLYLSRAALESDTISCGSQGIADLTGIQYFPNLRSLFAPLNALTSFDASLTPRLRTLNLNANDINSLDVSSLTHLEQLWCDGNGMTSLTLGELPNLLTLSAAVFYWYTENDEVVDQKSNRLEGLDLSGVPALQELYLRGNSLGTLDASGLNDLVWLECAGTPVTELHLPDHAIAGSVSVRLPALEQNDDGTYTIDLSAFLIPELYEKIDTSDWGEQKTYEPATGIVTLVWLPSGDFEVFRARETITYEDGATNDLFITVYFGGENEPDDYPYVSDDGIDPSSDFNAGGDDGIVPEQNEWPVAPTYDNAHPIDEIPIDAEHFPDANFREWIVRTLPHDTRTDAQTGEERHYLTGEQRWGVTVIDCRGRHIESLEGLAYFPNLEWLYCGRMNTEYVPEYAFQFYASNPITSLDLSGNPKLTRLYASYCRLTSIDLSDTPLLTHLNLFMNPIATLDLSHTPLLEELNFDVTDVSAFDPDDVPNLRVLRCRFSKLTELNLEGRDDLTIVCCSNIDTLQKLNLSGCTGLIPTECEIHDIGHLLELRMRNCSLPKIPTWIRDLEVLDCGDNAHFTSLDLSDCRNLRELYCDNCNLYRLDLSKNRKITILNCSYNHLKELNFTLVAGTETYGGDFYGIGQTADCAAGMQEDGGSYTFDMNAVVSPENLSRILTVSGATNYDPDTGVATFAAAADTLTYSYETQPSGIEYFSIPMTVTVALNVEMPDLPDNAIPIDAAHFPDANFRAWILKTLTPYYTEDAFGRQYFTEEGRNEVAIIDTNGWGVQSLEGIGYFPNIYSLYCGAGYQWDEMQYLAPGALTEVDLSANPNIADLSLNGNPLEEIDVSCLPVLQWLRVQRCRLTELDVSQNRNLAALWCDGNLLQTLTLPNPNVSVYPRSRAPQVTNDRLARVECQGNQIESLDLAGLSALKELNCESNGIAALDLADSESLGLLDCDDGVDITLPEGVSFCAQMVINEGEETEATYRCTSLAAAIDKITGRDGVTDPDEVQTAYITVFENLSGPALEFAADQQKTVVIDLDGHTYAAWSEPALIAYDNDVTVINGELIVKPIPAFATQQLILSGQIGVRFYIDLSMLTQEEKEAANVTFAITGRGADDIDKGPATLDPDKINSAGCFGFDCRVNALQMADTITATLHYGDGETVKKTYSVKEYFETWDTLCEAGETGLEDRPEKLAKTTALIHALADYGHYVQLFLSDVNGGEDGFIGDGSDQYASMDKFYATGFDTADIYDEEDNPKYPMTVTGDTTAFGGPTMSLVLDSETAIRIYFKPQDRVAFDTFSVTGKNKNGKVLAEGTDYTVTPTGSRYMVQINGVKASQLRDAYTIEATNVTDETSVSQTVTVYAVSYVARLLNSAAYGGNANARNAVCALWAYAQAAANY